MIWGFCRSIWRRRSGKGKKEGIRVRSLDGVLCESVSTRSLRNEMENGSGFHIRQEATRQAAEEIFFILSGVEDWIRALVDFFSSPFLSLLILFLRLLWASSVFG